MNEDLLDIVKRITADQGESILSQPKRLSAFLSDLAQDLPKPQKIAFIKCLEYGFAQTLKDVNEGDRALCKQRLAQKIYENEGLEQKLCAKTLDLLEEVLFGKQEAQKKNNCHNCQKEIQKEWIICPYCAAGILDEKTVLIEKIALLLRHIIVKKNEKIVQIAKIIYILRCIKKNILCKNCKKELQEGWKVCPYCATF